MDLSKIVLPEATSSVLRQMGVRLYVNHIEKETYINKHYWNYLPQIAKDALTIIYCSTSKENNNGN